MVIDSVLDIGSKVIDRLWPDPAKRDAAKLELFKLQQSGELQVIEQQLKINAAEAASLNPFNSGWRPGLGWICVAAFGMNFVAAPIVNWAVLLAGKQIVFPVLDMTEIMPVLIGMLGLAGIRSYEKVQGVASK